MHKGSLVAADIRDRDGLTGAADVDQKQYERFQWIAANQRCDMRVIITLNDELISFRIDLEKGAAVDLGMLAQGHGDGPCEFFGIGREANAFSEVSQKKRIGLCLLARCDVAQRDVNSK